MKIKKTLILIFSLCVFLLPSVTYCADWQSTLSQTFDVAESFDELADWRGGVGFDYSPSHMPKLADGVTPSIWDMYSNDTAAVDDWIKDHGDFKFGPSGKSLCINFNNFVGGIDGYGPSRLGLFLGDGVSGKSGYKKIHIFMMVKFRPGFFSMQDDTNFEYIGVFKFVELSSGFTNIDYYATASERTDICNVANYLSDYGLNYTIFNIIGGGASTGPNLLFQEEYRTAGWGTCLEGGEGWKLNYFDHKTPINGSFPLEDVYLPEPQWFGVEFIADIGTLGSSNGSQEIIIYDKSGNQIGHYTVSGYNKLLQFDHLYNKVVIGGNRFGSSYGEDPGDSDENRFYVDDFIIDDDYIGLKYFQARANFFGGDTSSGDTGAGDTTTPVTAPTGLKIISTQ